MKKTIWRYAVYVMICALCFVGCNAKDIPDSTVDETQKTTIPAATDMIQGTQNVETEPEEVGEIVEVTLPAENQDSKNETTAPTSGSGNDQQTNQETQAPSDGKVTYEVYNAMTAEEQQAFYFTFSDPQDFFDWYNAAKAEYEKNDGDITVGEDGVIDLEDLFGSNEG